MAILSAHYTELDAINDMLLSVGESPVSSLTSGLPDAALAQSILLRESRRIQAAGWGQNTSFGFELTRDSNLNIPVPTNALSVKPVTPRYGRKDNSPPSSSHIRASMRRASDGSKFLMWDNDSNRETWPHDTSLSVDMVLLMEFDNLSPALQLFIMKSAGHKFQKGSVGSGVLSQFTAEDVQEAMTLAEQEDADLRPLNILRDSPSIGPAIFRNNPLHGR